MNIEIENPNQERNLYLPCDCCPYNCHGLFVTAYHWCDNTLTYDLALNFNMSKAPLKERLIWAWRMLTGQERTHYPVELNEARAGELLRFLEDGEKILRWNREARAGREANSGMGELTSISTGDKPTWIQAPPPESSVAVYPVEKTA